MACRLLLFAALVGCGMFRLWPFPASPITGRELELVELTRTTFAAKFGEPTPEVCDAQLEDMRIAYLEGDEYRRACGTCAAVPGTLCAEHTWEDCPYGCSNECFRYADGLIGSINPRRRDPAIVISAHHEQRIRQRLVIHGATHWLVGCAGHDLTSDVHRTVCERDERGRYVVDENGKANCETVYEPGWRKAELEVQQMAGLR